MVTYDEMCAFTRQYNLLVNRIQCCNQLLGCRYKESPTNAIRIRCKKGVYTIIAYDVEVASFKVWDLDGLLSAYSYIDSWSDCLWHLSRMGRIIAA